MLPARQALCSVVLATVLVPGPAASQSSGGELSGSWPGFRGANRDGVSPETGLVDGWPKAGPSVAWRIRGGAGYSGIAIQGDRAFTLWQEGDAQVLVALDVAAGRLLWKRKLGTGYESSYGDGPRSTPVVDRERVFAIDAHGQLVAVRAGDGALLWSHDLEERFGARVPPIGYASTPLVEGDLLIVEVGASEGAFMAFHTATGERAWSSQSDEPAYASPIALTSGGERQVVFFSASGLYALAPADGRLLWHEPWPAPCPSTGIPLAAASPVFIAPDRLFVSAAWGDQKGGAVLRIVAGDNGLSVEKLWL
jgi:outer membrane protein assembly factor BamB